MNIADTKKIFEDYIRTKSLRTTKQRDIIVETFFSANKHFTAEDLYEILKKKHRNIGFATVYRTLKLMCECDLAEEVKIGINKTKYEQKYGHEHHDHLICLDCRKFIEVKNDKIEVLQEKLAKENDFLPTKHKLMIYGYCKKCQSRRK
jgi:Fur family ferric uptake transcriptional regulator